MRSPRRVRARTRSTLDGDSGVALSGNSSLSVARDDAAQVLHYLLYRQHGCRGHAYVAHRLTLQPLAKYDGNHGRKKVLGRNRPFDWRPAAQTACVDHLTIKKVMSMSILDSLLSVFRKSQ